MIVENFPEHLMNKFSVSDKFHIFFLHSISFILSDTSIFKNVYLSVLVENSCNVRTSLEKVPSMPEMEPIENFPATFSIPVRNVFQTTNGG